MSIELFLYLAEILSNLGCLFFIVGCLFLIGFLLLLIIRADAYECNKPSIDKKLKYLSAGAFTLLLLGALMPSSKTMYLIAGAHVGKEALNSQVGQKVKVLLESKLDEMIQEAQKNGDQQ